MPVGGGGSGGASSGGIRAGRAFIELSLKGVRDVARGLERVKSLVAGVSSVATRAGLGLSGLAGGGGIFAALGFDKLQDLAKQGSIAQALGLTAEQFTGIAGVAKSVGEDTREFIESLVTLGKVASEGALGKGEVAADFFKAINVNAKEFAGLRADEQFFQFFEAVRQVEKPLDKVRALMVAFGEDGGKLLLPLLSKTPNELRAMAGGFASTADEVRQAQAAQVAYAGATAALDKAWRSLAVGLAPAVERLGGFVARAAGPLGAFVSENRELIVAGIGAATAVGAAGAALAAFSPIVGGLITAVGPVTAVGGAVAALTTYLLKGTEAGDQLGAVLDGTFSGIAGAATGAFSGIRDDFARTWGGLQNALRGGDIARAAEIGFAGIEVAWERTLRALREAWERFKFGISEARETAVDATAKGISSVIGNAKAALTVALSNLPQALGGPNPADREKMINQVFQKIQAEENARFTALQQAAQVAAQKRKDEFQKGLDETLRESDQRIEAASQRLSAALVGGRVGAGALGLGGGLLAGIGTPGNRAQAVADAVNGLFPRAPRAATPAEAAAALAGLGAVGPLSALANAANSGDLTRRVSAAAANLDRIGKTNGIFGGGNGIATQIFGGGSPVVQILRQELEQSKMIRQKLVDIYDVVRTNPGAVFG